jgi:superfamily II DNA/RNA helicase
MNETDTFETSNIKILVIDEVDRILDMGFKDTIE